MRKYTFASTEAQSAVDLRDYREFIEKTIHEIMSDAEVVVTQTYYTVSPSPSKGDAIRIGRKLSKNKDLGQHCIKIPKLFNGENIETGKELSHDDNKQKHNGGHF